MIVYLFEPGLLHFLFPGRPVVTPGELLGEPRVLVIQQTKKPAVEYETALELYDDVVFIQNDARGVDLMLHKWDDVITYAVRQHWIRESKRARTWFQKASTEDAIAVLKLALARGRWDWSMMKKQAGVYRLYDAISRSRRDKTILAWFEVTETRPGGGATACLLSFASRAARREHTRSQWMSQVMERSRKMCDFSPSSVEPLLLYDEGIPLGAASLATALKMARCWH